MNPKQADINIVAIIQARMNSRRLPGKVLKPVLGKPLLELMIERVLRSKKIMQVVVSTSIQGQDDLIANLAKKLNIDCFRGNLDDVLDRYYRAACRYHADPVVRLTADCPLIDPGIIDEVISAFLSNKNKVDYVSNTMKLTYPDGLDVSAFSFRILQAAWEQARLPSEREHVVPWMLKRLSSQTGSEFKSGSVCYKKNYSHLRWTVDEAEDFEFVKRVFEKLYPGHPEFSWLDILELVEKNPELGLINKGIARNEGYAKSLKQDKKFYAK